MPQDLLNFPPTYCIVGVYRLLTDVNLRRPIWDKCKHGVVRGAIVGSIWAAVTWNIQKPFISLFLYYSPRVTGVSDDAFLGYHVPVATYATFLFISSQVTWIFNFFLAKNIRIARDRAWNQTVESRGKRADFWGSYVEEWQVPPKIKVGGWKWDKWVGGFFGRFVVKKAILAPLNFYPVVGIVISAMLKAVGTARYLHKPYFTAKKMTEYETAVYMEERKWDYWSFGFMAALLESVPIIGLAFTVSNRIGAAMWAFDLEKRQHLFRSGTLKPLPPRVVTSPDGEVLNLRPRPEGSSARAGGDEMAGGWKEE